MVQLCNNLNESAVRACFIERQAKGNHIQNAKQQQTPYMKSWEKVWERLSSFGARSSVPWNTILPVWEKSGQRYGSQEAQVKSHVLWFLFRFKAGHLSADFLCAQVRILFSSTAPWAFDGCMLVTEDGAGHVQVTSICGAFVWAESGPS